MKTIAKIGPATIVLVVAFAICGCANPVLSLLKNQLVLGEWVNSAGSYDTWPMCSDFILKADGVLRSYDRMSSIWSTDQYTIADEWSDSDGHYFKILYDMSAGTAKYYTLVRISADGLTYEANYLRDPPSPLYPTSINPADLLSYVIAYRK